MRVLACRFVTYSDDKCVHGLFASHAPEIPSRSVEGINRLFFTKILKYIQESPVLLERSISRQWSSLGLEERRPFYEEAEKIREALQSSHSHLPVSCPSFIRAQSSYSSQLRMVVLSATHPHLTINYSNRNHSLSRSTLSRMISRDESAQRLRSVERRPHCGISSISKG